MVEIFRPAEVSNPFGKSEQNFDVYIVFFIYHQSLSQVEKSLCKPRHILKSRVHWHIRLVNCFESKFMSY